MNRQGPGKIGWADYTWSPVTGCKHACQYGPRKKCYADLIAQRIYKEKFEPTFRPERLGEPVKLKVPSKIFVCDMGDLFGEWVPDVWILKVLRACYDAPQHIYQFLTKNPERYLTLDEFLPNNSWIGTTIEKEEFYKSRSAPFWKVRDDLVRFVSMEPLLGPMPVDDAFDWIIIGELTGKAMTQDEVHQVRVWAQEIIDQAGELKIPVFVKNALGAIFPQREFPKVKT